VKDNSDGVHRGMKIVPIKFLMFCMHISGDCQPNKLP